MTETLALVVAALGITIPALAAFATQWLGARDERRRQLFDQQLAAFSDVMKALAELEGHHTRHEGNRGLDRKLTPFTSEERRELADLIARFVAAGAVAQLFVSAAGRKSIDEQIWLMRLAVDPSVDMPQSEWWWEVLHSRAQFVQTLALELGVVKQIVIDD